MIYILSFLGIIIENSLPLSGVVLIVTLPFFTYLVNLKRIRSVTCIFLMTLIMSIQTHNFVEHFIIMAIFYYLFNFIFVNMIYNRENIIFISLLQIGVYFILNYENYSRFYLILNLVGFLIINYFYIRHMRKKNIRGQQ